MDKKWHLIVTVGTSAIYNDGIGKRLGPNGHKSLSDRVRLYKGSANKKRSDNPDLFQSLAAENRGFFDQLEIFRKKPSNTSQVSAELLSTGEIVPDIKPLDILLLTSHTDEGYFAGEVNGEALSKLYPRIKTSVHQLEGLDQKFDGVFEALRYTIDEQHWDETDGLAFNVTGGFKGTLLYVAAYALDKGARVYYRHEQMEQTMVMELDAARKVVFRRSRK